MLKRAVCLVVLLAGVAGCGGTSQAERHAAWVKWTRAADAVCRDTAATLRRRGGAAGYRGIAGMAAKARVDLRAAAARLRRIPRPDGVAERARPFLASLGRIDPALGKVIAVARTTHADDEIKAAETLREQAYQFEFQSRKAGLRVCGAGTQRDDAVDALTAPAFATIVARFHVLLFKAIVRIDRKSGETPGAAVRSLDRMGITVDDAVALYGRYRAPERVTFAAQQYCNALSRFSNALYFYSRALRARPIAIAAVQRRAQRLKVVGRLADRRFTSLERKLSEVAPPTPGAGSQDDPTAPAGGDDQADA
jgi:hypothetical protein